MATPALGFDNYFSTTLSSSITNTDTVIPLNAVPTASEGYLAIDQDNGSREIIYYTSKGGSSVTCPSLAAGRGVGGTSAVAHASGATAKAVVVAEHFEALQDATAWGADARTLWIPGSGTWTYASATTFTVPADDASALAVGSKIKLTQTSAKYFYVTGISGTTITVTGGSDYSVANAAITAPYFSNAATPQGFPDWFNWSPTLTNLTAGNGTTVARFKMQGKLINLYFRFTFGSTSSMGTNPQFSLPVAASSNFQSGLQPLGVAVYEDAGTSSYWGRLTYLATNIARLVAEQVNVTYNQEVAITSTIPHTWANTDVIRANGFYEAA